MIIGLFRQLIFVFVYDPKYFCSHRSLFFARNVFVNVPSRGMHSKQNEIASNMHFLPNDLNIINQSEPPTASIDNNVVQLEEAETRLDLPSRALGQVQYYWLLWSWFQLLGAELESTTDLVDLLAEVL